MLRRGPIIVAVVGYGFFVYIDCSKITDTILHNAMSTVTDNNEIENKSGEV